jgi:hypothetical protein
LKPALKLLLVAPERSRRSSRDGDAVEQFLLGADLAEPFVVARRQRAAAVKLVPVSVIESFADWSVSCCGGMAGHARHGHEPLLDQIVAALQVSAYCSLSGTDLLMEVPSLLCSWPGSMRASTAVLSHSAPTPGAVMAAQAVPEDCEGAASYFWRSRSALVATAIRVDHGHVGANTRIPERKHRLLDRN